MELLKSGYDFHPKNYSKPTPFWLKVVADCLIGSILVLDPIFLAIPDFPNKEWFLFGWNAFCALFKLISKTVADAKAQQAV